MSKMNPAVVTRQGAQKAKIQTRSMQKQSEARKPSAALLEAKKRARENSKTADVFTIKDIYHTAMDCINTKRGETGLVFDRRMADHLCLWDKGYPECPERFTSVMDRCEELKLIERCELIQPRSATESEIRLKHTQEQYDILKATSGLTNEDKLEDLSSHYDAIYIHPTTFNLCLLSCGSTIDLVEKVVTGSCQNGMAIIRPPGHHAMKAEYNGYCFFNNVAVAAQHALNNLGVGKILIVDWDVHHGQGTQRMFYDDPRVVYFSIHRYEHGTFWPNLRESDFDYIGEGNGTGYNFNLPLNKTGMTNADYLAIWQQILLPIVGEFKPEIIIVSAGYDAAFGCPEGEMEITPACYSHLLSPLMAFAQGKVAVVLEGGYCLGSLSEGAAITLKTLLGDPCPIMEPLLPPCESMQDSILNCIHAHRPYWRSLQLQQTYNLTELNNVNPQPDIHKVSITFNGGPPRPERFATRSCYPLQSSETKRKIDERLSHLKIITNLTFPLNRVCYVYDEIMTQHENLFDEVSHPERPERISTIFKRFEEYLLADRMKLLTSRQATTDELRLVHANKHINFIRKAVEKGDLREISEKFNSVYLHASTFDCATLAAGSVLQVVDEVLNGNSRSGVCVVRPPGHHAEPDTPHGFCIFNNVAIAAQYAIRDHGLKRVLIIDWDVHHGNGIQHIFEKDPNVLYISLHRYDYGAFFPSSQDGDYTVVGEGQGEGFNVNIPWNKRTMGDTEYITAFQHIILPIAYEFNPELVIVSAGFDAAIGDPLGKYKVSPEAYGYFTHWLSALANGRIIVCLEGGYNVNAISYSMTMCAKTLLGDPLPPLQTFNRTGINSSCVETLQNVVSVQKKYWKCLQFYKKLPYFEQQHNTSAESSPAVDSSPISRIFNKLSLEDSPTVISSPSSSSTSSSPGRDADSNDKASAGGSGGKSSDLTGGEKGNEAGPSRPVEKTKTLVDYLSENMEALVNEEMYAVVPLKFCPHLSCLRLNEAPNQIKTSSPCQNCASPSENWICLSCSQVYCGRYIMEHMLYHHLETEHPLTLSFSDLSVWCYKCEAYIDNPILHKYKNLAHNDKFGEELAWSYGEDTLVLQTEF